MKIEMKIGRYIKHISEKDLILDNGSLIQVTTQCGAYKNWNSAPLIMSKKLFNELKRFRFIYIDEELTKKANEKYSKPWLFYYRFNIDKLIKTGSYTQVEEKQNEV